MQVQPKTAVEIWPAEVALLKYDVSMTLYLLSRPASPDRAFNVRVSRNAASFFLLHSLTVLHARFSGDFTQ